MLRASVLILAACCPIVSIGYGLDTHRQMSIAAVKAAVVNDPAIFKQWGITGTASSVFLPRTSDGQSLSVVNLIAAEGAINEDDNPRAINHFFDPTRGAALTICSQPLTNHASPDWAVLGLGQDEPVFSYAQARKSMQLAFSAVTKSERDAKLGKVFESLGHVIHHIQDMGQPQHVRNDQHLEIPWRPLGQIPVINNKSRYEDYAERTSDSLSYIGYDNVRLPFPTDYWFNTNHTGLVILQFV